MKKVLAVLVTTTSLLALTSCDSSQVPDNPDRQGAIIEQKMPDGSVVNCVWYKWGYAGGLSCDFDNAVTP